jgi:SAM-dependent methyltransferase
MANQDVFRQCYRGRQTAWHHMSYMRMAKVLLSLTVLEKAGIDLKAKSVFDYGFGAGTFFRYCPMDSRLFGVEIDSENIAGVNEMLSARGHQSVCLDTIDISTWEQHPLWRRKYDIFLCSHVLEHLPDPVSFLRRSRKSLNPGGAFVGLVPLNERRANPHHVCTLSEAQIRHWAAECGLKVECYLEGDPWTYWVQPLYTFDSSLHHKLAQSLSLALGIPATLVGHRLWRMFGKIFGTLTFSKPTQAAFVLAQKENQ